jgi:hypothetical protein
MILTRSPFTRSITNSLLSLVQFKNRITRYFNKSFILQNTAKKSRFFEKEETLHEVGGGGARDWAIERNG